MQTLAQSNKIVLTKEQVEKIQAFKQDLQNGSADIAFEGSLIEGGSYLQGLAEIVEATSNA